MLARPLARHPYLAPFRARLGPWLEGVELPSPEVMTAQFASHRAAWFPDEPPLRFVPQAPGRARRRGDTPIDPDDSYDGSIVVRHEVPTRPGDAHDFFNFVLWCCLPRSKRAVHTRQLKARRAWIPPGATRIPGQRTREQDALTLFDEGGLVGTRGGPWLVFGHAVLEHFCASDDELAVTFVELAMPESLEALDATLASMLLDPSRFLEPRTLRPTLLDGAGQLVQR